LLILTVAFANPELEYEVLPVDYVQVCVSENILFGVNANTGLILNSTDYGQTWQEITQPNWEIGEGLSALYISQNGTLFCGGQKIDSNGTLFRSSDFGESWHRVLTLHNNSWLGDWGQHFSECNGHILVCEYGLVTAQENRGVYHSEDSGQTWEEVYTTIFGWNELYGLSSHLHFAYIDPYDYNWYISEGDYEGACVIKKSIDEGQNWVTIDEHTATACIADKFHVHFGIDEAPYGFVVHNKYNDTMTDLLRLDDFHSPFYPTWDFMKYKDYIIASATCENTIQGTFYRGYGENLENWELIEAWDKAIKDRSDRGTLSKIDDEGYIYVNSWHDNLWRIKADSLMLEEGLPEQPLLWYQDLFVFGVIIIAIGGALLLIHKANKRAYAQRDMN